MNIYILILFLLVSGVWKIEAQTSATLPRLAIISESDDTATVADVLTAQLSNNQKLQLLERDQIAKIYREQGISAGNTDYLKLGHLLGADGLLLMETTREGTNQFLNIRLVAVKPGVVLASEKIACPVKDPAPWATGFAQHLDEFLPKLTVLTKDAIPISVVNLRSAIASADASETERQLKLLTIQRLSRERQFFVLERQKMQSLTEEKDLKAEDSAFWNGSYLLEAVVDQNGYLPDTITINARLVPSRGGTPFLLAVSGSRTNLAEVVNQLAVKVAAALKIQSTAAAWNAGDEAAQYFAEANWAMSWGLFAEARMASDSAWALGKKDLDCARVRVKAYGSGLQTDRVQADGFMAASAGSNSEASDRQFMAQKNQEFSKLPATVTWERTAAGIGYLAISGSSDAQSIDQATYALELYYAFSQNSPEVLPKVLTRGPGWNDWHNSEWYQLGIDTLVAASKVLLDFNMAPNLQKSEAEQLAELRARARAVAKLISTSPTVHDTYFVGNRLVTHDELGNTVGEHPNIFSCELTWGCLWQETPEDEITLYHDLMTSPVFDYIHSAFWIHRVQIPVNSYFGLEPPRLVAWNVTGQARIPQVWNQFTHELSASTNLLWQLEAKALALADATNDTEMGASFTNFFQDMLENRAALVDNNVEVLYLDWQSGDLMEKMGGAWPPKIKDDLEQVYYHVYQPQLEAMDQEYWNKTIPNRKLADVFAAQKQYLQNNTPYDFQKFDAVFENENYTKAQAAELLPLLAAYQSNLLAQAENEPHSSQFLAKSNQRWIDLFVTQKVKDILNPPALRPRPQLQSASVPPKPISPPAPEKKTAASPPPADPATEPGTNILEVNQFLEIPLAGLPGDKINAVTITAHHWVEGKLLLDFQYNAFVYSFNQQGDWKGTSNVTFPAIAILDPATEHWEVIGCPETDLMAQSRFYHRSMLFHGELFTCDGGQIKKYDPAQKQWRNLAVSDGENYELFAVNDRLYAANETMIFEIADEGKSTRILASTRRQPPVSALDTQELGTPTVFAGPEHSLRISTKNKIYTWTGSDWTEDSPAPPASFPGIIFPNGVLFATDGFNRPACLSWLATDAKPVIFGLGNFAASSSGIHFFQPGEPIVPVTKPVWKIPRELSLSHLPATVDQSSWYLLEGHSGIQTIADADHSIVMEKVLNENGYNVALLCFSPGLPAPQKAFLKFEAPDACPPLAGADPDSHQVSLGLPSAWLLFARDMVMFASETPAGALPSSLERPLIGYKTGVWMVPRPRLKSILDVERNAQLTDLARAADKMKLAQRNLLDKYDLNHNGIIDPEEREPALDDPAFIESALDEIDTNHNGWLNAAELAWFDSNQNKILEPKEQAGIDLARHLLTERLLEKFDQNDDGVLGQREFVELVQACSTQSTWAPPNMQFNSADTDHNNRIDLNELEEYLQRQTMRDLRPGRMQGMDFSRSPAMRSAEQADRRLIFKTAVEHYWRHLGDPTNRPPGDSDVRFNPGFPPNLPPGNPP